MQAPNVANDYKKLQNCLEIITASLKYFGELCLNTDYDKNIATRVEGLNVTLKELRQQNTDPAKQFPLLLLAFSRAGVIFSTFERLFQTAI